MLGRPFGADEEGVLIVRNDVEPDPAAVAELIEDQLERVRLRTLRLARLDPLADTGAGRAIHEDRAAALGADGECDLPDTRPVLPVGRRESIEVGSEGHSPARDDPCAVPTEDVSDMCAVGDAHRFIVDDGPRLGVDVQGQQIWITVVGEHDVLQDVRQEQLRKDGDWRRVEGPRVAYPSSLRISWPVGLP